jgi:hypothetical protein
LPVPVAVVSGAVPDTGAVTLITAVLIGVIQLSVHSTFPSCV